MRNEDAGKGEYAEEGTMSGVWVGGQEEAVEVGGRGRKEEERAVAHPSLLPTPIMSMEHAPHTVVDIEPCEAMNIYVLSASELTHASPHSV